MLEDIPRSIWLGVENMDLINAEVQQLQPWREPWRYLGNQRCMETLEHIISALRRVLNIHGGDLDLGLGKTLSSDNGRDSTRKRRTKEKQHSNNRGLVVQKDQTKHILGRHRHQVPASPPLWTWPRSLRAKGGKRNTGKNPVTKHPRWERNNIVDMAPW